MDTIHRQRIDRLQPAQRLAVFSRECHVAPGFFNGPAGFDAADYVTPGYTLVFQAHGGLSINAVFLERTNRRVRQDQPANVQLLIGSHRNSPL